MHRLAPRTITYLATALVAALPARAAAQPRVAFPSGPDVSTTDMQVLVYEEIGGPTVERCRFVEVASHFRACGNALSGTSALWSTGAGGALRTQNVSMGAGVYWGELEGLITTRLSGQMIVDLTPRPRVAFARGDAMFHLTGSLYAAANGERGHAYAGVGYTAGVTGGPGAQTQYAFASACYIFGCFDRWTVSATASGGGNDVEQLVVSERRGVTLELTPGQLNVFTVFLELSTWTGVTGGWLLDDPKPYSGSAGAFFQNTAGLLSLALTGSDANGDPVDLSDVPITFSAGLGFLPDGPSDIPDLPFPQVTATPEPGTWALLATGLLALGAVARRRRG